MPYPASFPVAACNTLIDYFTPGGTAPPLCDVAEAAYDVQGYMMAKAIPHDHPPVTGAGPAEPQPTVPPKTDAEKAAVLVMLREACVPHAEGVAAPPKL